jgi:hypothetical protein
VRPGTRRKPGEVRGAQAQAQSEAERDVTMKMLEKVFGEHRARPPASETPLLPSRTVGEECRWYHPQGLPRETDPLFSAGLSGDSNEMLSDVPNRRSAQNAARLQRHASADSLSATKRQHEFSFSAEASNVTSNLERQNYRWRTIRDLKNSSSAREVRREISDHADSTMRKLESLLEDERDRPEKEASSDERDARRRPSARQERWSIPQPARPQHPAREAEKATSPPR